MTAKCGSDEMKWSTQQSDNHIYLMIKLEKSVEGKQTNEDLSTLKRDVNETEDSGDGQQKTEDLSTGKVDGVQTDKEVDTEMEVDGCDGDDGNIQGKRSDETEMSDGRH